MIWHGKTVSLWLRLLVALLIIGVASMLRAKFFGGLGRGTPYLLYYPSVMLAALYGGLPAGLLATVFSVSLSALWIQQGTLSQPELMAMATFSLSCLLISGICEAMHRAWAGAKVAQEETKITHRELQSEIAERKCTELELRVAHERLELAQSAARVGLWDWNITAGTIEWDVRMFELFGLDQGKTSASFATWRQVVHPEDLAAAEALIGQALRDHMELVNTYRIVLSDGKVRWIQSIGRGSYGADGQPHRMIGLCLDITTSKQAEEALKRSREDFQGYFEMGSLGMCVTSPEKGWVAVNDRLCQMLGYSKAELIGFSWIDLTHPDDLGADLQFFEEVKAGKRERYELEKRFIRKDGYVVYTTLSVSCHRNADGTINHLLASLLEITERKRTEEALRQSEASMQAVLRAAADGLLAVNKENRVLLSNGRFAEMWRIPPELLVGRDDAAVLQHVLDQLVDPPGFLRQVQELYESSEESLDTLDFKDGRVFERLSRPLLEQGKLAGRVWSFRDVTERKRAQGTLRESEAKYRLVFASSPQPLWIYDIETLAFLEVNEAAERHYGYRKDEFLTMTLKDIRPPEDVPALICDVLQAKEHHIQTGEWRHLKKSGELILVEVVAHPVVFRGRHARHVLIIDITARKQAEAERAKLEALNRQLLKTESLGRMAGAIAHRLNNQIQAVMLNLELATRSRPGNAGPLESLVEAKQSAREAAEVGTLMLTYLGQAQVKKAQLDLAEVCRQSLALLRSAMPRGVVLETDLPTPGPVISADANQLQQVLTNLITNSWEASGEGRGAIRLSVKTVSAAVILASVRFPINWQPQDRATSYACLEVADAGGGIAAKDFDKLFDPFFSTKFTGRGLGLPVVLGIARSHDGVVTVESEPGRGSVFRVLFPVSAEAASRKPIPVQVGPITRDVRRGSTVLVAEDEPIVRKTLVLLLKHSGLTVLEAEDGVAAVEIFRQHRDEIGCVVCDLTMPRMNGWETLTALRQLVPGIGVILASGYSEAHAMAGDHPERPQAFLHKPYDAKVLINAINQVLTLSNA